MFTTRPDRTLLNSKFEGYKLHPISQEDVIRPYNLCDRPSQGTVSGRVPLSFHEVQSKIRHNHLVVDSKNRQAFYVDGDLHVVQAIFDVRRYLVSWHAHLINRLP